MWPNMMVDTSSDLMQDFQRSFANDIINRKGKKGKQRKNWENQNAVWQGKRRFG